MANLHENRFPNEDESYRQRRDELLQREIDLRKKLEEVAALRRQLPQGGKLKEDYVFDEAAGDPGDIDNVVQTRFSSLFDEGKKNLLVYSFMFAPEAETPCPA